MSTFHTTGIVLRVSPSGENDRRASIYTHDFGKLEVFAKSARRIQSKLSPHLEPLTLVDCFIARGQVDHLAGIERQDRFIGVRGSLEQLTSAWWAAELVDALTRPDHPDPRIFRLLQIWITMVETANGQIPEYFRLVFVITLFDYLGYGLHSDGCVKCKKENDLDWLFSARDGGLVCRDCRAHAAPGGIVLAPAARQALASMTAKEFPIFDAAAFAALPEKIARLISDRLIAEHLDRPLATDVFGQSIKTAASS
ncbi:MAG: DNA repair protein RecO [bacterium]|nr:DNA repair protein RecO [bacterium]